MGTQSNQRATGPSIHRSAMEEATGTVPKKKGEISAVLD
jgi:hypothetical protein